MGRYRKSMSEALGEVHLHENDYLKSKLNDTQIANIKQLWKTKTAKDVTPSIKDMIKKMDIPTQLAIKHAGINQLSKLVEEVEEINEGYEGSILAYLKKYVDNAHFKMRKLMVRKGAEGVVKTALQRGIDDKSSVIYSYQMPQIVSEETELEEMFSDSQIARLKKEYEPMRGKTISTTNATKLGAMFTSFDKNKNALEKLYGGNIPFISTMAMTRLISKHGYKAADLKKIRKEEVEYIDEGVGHISGFRDDKEKANVISLAKQHGLKVDSSGAKLKISGNMRAILDIQLAVQGNGLKAEDVRVSLEEFNEGRMKDIWTMDQEGKSAKEIAKALKLNLKTVKDILGEVKEDLEESAAASEIQKNTGPRDGMDYNMYKKTVELLKKKDYKALGKHIYDAETAPREYVMGVIAKKEPQAFKKMFGNQTGYYSLMKPLKMSEDLEEKIQPFMISYSKHGQHAGFEGGDSLQDIQNKAQKLRAKGFTIDKMGRYNPPVKAGYGEQKEEYIEEAFPKPEAEGGKEAIAKKDAEIALLKQKAETEKEKHVQKQTAKQVNPETGEPLLQVGIAYKHLRDKMAKEKASKEDEKKEVKENIEVQVTLKGPGPENKRSHVHDFDNPAAAKKWIKWYKTGNMNKVQSIKMFDLGKAMKYEGADPITFGPDRVAKAMAIAVKSGGMYSKAVREIEKIAKNLSTVSTIARALKRANETKEHPSKATFERIRGN